MKMSINMGTDMGMDIMMNYKKIMKVTPTNN
jgi:hypothetical protein